MDFSALFYYKAHMQNISLYHSDSEHFCKLEDDYAKTENGPHRVFMKAAHQGNSSTTKL